MAATATIVVMVLGGVYPEWQRLLTMVGEMSSLVSETSLLAAGHPCCHVTSLLCLGRLLRDPENHTGYGL